MKYFIYLFILLACVEICLAQARKDSVVHKDSVLKQSLKRKTDSSVTTKQDSAFRKVATSLKQGITLKRKAVSSVIAKHDSIAFKAATSAKLPTVAQTIDIVLHNHPYFNFFGQPRYEIVSKRADRGQEGLFYLLTGVVLYFSLVRLLFRKYLNNLFSVFFRVSLKQKQIREQLLQSPLPSLLLNIFFIISGGIYISFLLRYYNFRGTENLWYLILNSILALGLVYLVKFIGLKMMGWIFNITEATDTYVFVVFLVNKLLGILLIPFLILLAFSDTPLIAVLVTLSFSVVVIFFGYRYFISYAPVRKEIKVSQFHFFLYLCAFEIIPLLLIYKVLLTFLERSS